MKVSSIQPTPNPNAFKFLVDQQLAKSGQTLAYANPEQARNDVLAQGMFAIPGVETLFFCDNFVTVSMTGKADWQLLRTPDGALVGVASTSPGEPVKKAGFAADQKGFAGANCYCDWRFVFRAPATRGDLQLP